MASSMTMQLELGDQIPYADGSCDGSVSSIGTGSILGHSTSEEDLTASRERLWKYREEQQGTQEDHDSLNNILDTVTSSSTKLADLEDDESVDKLDRSTCSSTDAIKKDGEPVKDADVLDGGSTGKATRPTSLNLAKDLGRTSLASAYFSLSEQLSDNYGYESIYNNSCSYGVINGNLSSPSKSIQSTSSSQQPHHYISSYRAKASLSKRSGAKAAGLAYSPSSSSAGIDRAGQDPVSKLQALLKQRYQRLADDRPFLAWCNDFRPPLRNLVFGLARDASWEMGASSGGTPNLRRIPLHGLLAEDRRSERKTGKRILVVGDTGHGKTTLLLRLAHDWSTQDPASGYLAHYRLVYLVCCRDGPAGRSAIGTVSKEEAELALSIGAELESQTLYLVDGLDELSSPWPDDLKELIEGKSSPLSTVLVTSRPVASGSGYSSFHKRIVLHGLEQSHIEAFVSSYFSDPDSGMRRLLNSRPRLAKLAACPLMCVLLCSTYREESCQLPDSIADLYALLFRKVVGGSLKQDGHLSTHQRKMLLDFGKLALQGIKEDRYFYTDAEIKGACQSLEILKWGFLLKGVTAKSGKRVTYQTIHSSWSEYAAALYLASVSHYANIIQREVFSLPLDAEPCLATSTGIQRSCLQVLIFLCSILSKKAYLLFNILEPLDFPCATLLNFLHTAGRSNANVAAIGKLIHGHANIATSSDDQLESWASLIDHPECLLHSLAIRYDGKVERKSLQSLVEVIGRNSTLNTIKLTAVIGQDLEGSDLNLVARHLALMMGKPKLQALELAVSSMDDETAVVDVVQPLVDALSCVIGGTLISKLSLDVDLTANQVDQLCKALQTSSVRSLHVQHLSCAWSGLQAVTSLIAHGSASAVTNLDLSGCWAPSNSPSNGHQEIDNGMGTLSGSSTCSTGSPTPTPTTPVPSTHSPRPKKSDQQFLSLPRRPTRGSRSYSSLTRAGQRTDASPGPFSSSGYLSRTDEKRRSDSMLFQKVLLPLPACDRSSHLHCGFHLVFDALRHPGCRLTQLNLSKSSITVSDAMCLGESLRKNRTLVSLRLEGLSSLKEVLPVCLALAENKNLQLLDVSSNHVAVNDSAFQLICRALGRNGSLQSLRMCGWTFNLEEDDTFKALSDAIQSSRLRELALSSSLVKLSFQEKRSPLSAALLGPVVLDDLVALMAKEVHDQVQSDWMAFMKLDNCRLELCNKLTLRGAHLVCFASGFQKLAELNLSLDPSANAEPLRDKASLAFFQTLSNSCNQLKTLVLQNWNLHWSKPDKVLKGIAKSLKNTSLNSISMDGLKLTSDQSGINEAALALMFISSLSTLSSMSLNGWKLSGQDAIDLGKTIRDKMAGSVLELSLKNVPSQIVRTIVRLAEESGRVTSSRNGCVYRFKKSSRAPSFLNKMMFITSSWKD